MNINDLNITISNNDLKGTMYQQYKSKMNTKVNNIELKNHTYYIYDDIINMKYIDPNNIKIDGKSYKEILIYYIGYVMIKDLKYIKD